MKKKLPPIRGLKGKAAQGVQPKQSTTLTPKELQKRAKVNRQWRLAMDFLFRQLATITFRFNYFFSNHMTDFAKAMSDGDEMRAQLKLKKSDKPRIWNHKTMLEAADLLEAAQQIDEATQLRTLVDLSGRTRTWGTMVVDLQKMMTVEDEDEEDEIKFLLDSVQAYTNRTIDFSLLKFVYKVDLSEFTELEKQYLNWPVAVRTALFHGARFLKMASDNSGTPLLPTTDPTYLLRNMQAPEFVLALNLDDALNERTTEEEKQMKILLGPGAVAAKEQDWERPNVDDVDPELLQPIGPKTLMLHFPTTNVSLYTSKSKKNKDKKRK